MSERIKPPKAQDLANDLMMIAIDAHGLKQWLAADVGAGVFAMEVKVKADRKAVIDWYRSNLALLFGHMGLRQTCCRSCGADIFWVEGSSGSKWPVTVDGLNHFADCPHAALHRKKDDDLP